MNNQKGDPVMKIESPAENKHLVDETSERGSDFLDTIPVWSEEQIERYGNLYKNTECWDSRIE